MNAFDKKISALDAYPLKAEDVACLQVNMGYRCNLRCSHCHVEASPERTEEMPLDTVNRVIGVLKQDDRITSIDITGGSPELNPHYKKLIKAAADLGKAVTTRTNLAVYSERGMEDIPGFLADHKVKIIASLPCYSEEGVDSQRGKGTYARAISALKHLNKLGYGQNGAGLEVDIMFNPAGPETAPEQGALESAYKVKLKTMHGITFDNLIALSNMPVGRLKKRMSNDEVKSYIEQLKGKFNPETLKGVMCRHLISVAPGGTLYDCDFWQMMKLSVKSKVSCHIKDFEYDILSSRDIVTSPLCFMCTAGAGASCSGALA